ncbi:MAG: hypothetical protein J2P31_15490, partial [Blastocatellia bacterium]|nr:hypothetical protein [Blastocatellia bacterium]
MPGDVHVPGVGKIPKWGIYGAVGIGVIFIGYRWYSSKQAAATSTTAGTATTDPTIDPSTGVPYSEEYGYGSDYGTAGFGAAGAYPGSLAYYDPTT